MSRRGALARRTALLDAVTPVSRSRSGDGYWRGVLGRLLRDRVAAASLALVAVFIVLALLAPLITVDPSKQDFAHTFEPPSLSHLAGTDNLGRDWFSRMLYGGRLSLSIGLFSQALVLAIGLPVGLLAGYFGRRVDSLLMRATDLVYAFPDLLLIILLRSLFGGSLVMLFLVIGLVTWVDAARLVRGQALVLREQEFVEAARSLGAGHREIMVRHLLPNLLGPLAVLLALGIPRAIFIEASLSFIGIGVNPGTPSWGSMVQEGYAAIYGAPHLVIFPAAAIALVMLAFSFLADGLRDALDPRTPWRRPAIEAPASWPPAVSSEDGEQQRAA